MTSHFLSIAFVIYSFGINLCRNIHASCQSLDGWLFISGFDIIVMQNQLVSAQTYMTVCSMICMVGGSLI